MFPSRGDKGAEKLAELCGSQWATSTRHFISYTLACMYIKYNIDLSGFDEACLFFFFSSYWKMWFPLFTSVYFYAHSASVLSFSISTSRSLTILSDISDRLFWCESSHFTAVLSLNRFELRQRQSFFFFRKIAFSSAMVKRLKLSRGLWMKAQDDVRSCCVGCALLAVWTFSFTNSCLMSYFGICFHGKTEIIWGRGLLRPFFSRLCLSIY